MPRRVCAVAAVPVTGSWTFLLAAGIPSWVTVGAGAAWALTTVYAVVAPTACYAAARVLRPHRRRDDDRLIRHPLAAAGAAYGGPIIVASWLSDVTGWSSAAVGSAGSDGLGGWSGDDVILAAVFLFGLAAMGLGLLTAAWGCLAVVIRGSGLLVVTVVRHRARTG